MCWKPLNTYLKLIETKFPIKNGRNIPQLNIAMASAILNPGHDENAKPEAAPTTLPSSSMQQKAIKEKVIKSDFTPCKSAQRGWGVY